MYLLLDEPTNHLDIPAREALETALAEYPATLFIISHDRYLLNNLATKLLIFDGTPGGTATLFEGNYAEYIAAQEEHQKNHATSRKRFRHRSRNPQTPPHKSVSRNQNENGK